MPSYVSAPLAFVIASAAALVLYLNNDVRFPVVEVPTTFRAYEYANYGEPREQLKLVDTLALPKLLKSHVRIKVVSAALNPIDYKLVQAGFNFFPVGPSDDAPFRIGFDAAGTVVEVGGNVRDFKVGDAVYTATPFNSFGTVAQYISVDAQYVARKPASLSFDQAAGVPFAAQTSYQAIVTHAKVQRDERVLILGGSGGTGIFAVQIAKALGAHVITTTSFRNTEFVKSLGADEVIDYTKEKWSDVLAPHSVDVIYDCGMEPASWNSGAQKVLKRDGAGRFVTLLDIPEPIESPIGAQWTRMVVRPNGADLLQISALVERGQLVSHVDSVYPFGNLLNALDKLQSGHVRGKVVIHVSRAAE